MSDQLLDVSKACPYCGECIDLEIDLSSGSQDYYEDCFVCCRPIFVSLQVIDEATVHVELRSDHA